MFEATATSPPRGDHEFLLDVAMAAALAAGRPEEDLLAGWGENVPPELLLEMHADMAPDRPALKDLATAPPTASVVAVLADHDAAQLDDDQRLDLLIALNRCAAWLDALTQRALASLGTPCGPAAHQCPTGDPLRQSLSELQAERWVREEVGAALRISPVTADRRLTVAWALCGDRRPSGRSTASEDATGDDPAEPRLPGTCAALAQGAITAAHARAAVEHTAPLDPAQCQVVERRVLRRAGRQSVGEFTRALKTAVMRAAPASATERAARARLERRTWIRPLEDGMGLLCAVLSAEDAVAGHAALTARADQARQALQEQARRAGLDWREADPGLDALRADALAETLRAVLAEPDLPTRQGRRTQINVTVSLATLLGLADDPGQLAGYGPIPAPFARALAADGSWRRLVTDPVTGYLLDFGRNTYEPPAALRDFVLARDVTSRFPHDPRAAERCDLDHAVEWASGGPTSAANLGALARRQHTAKTLGHWTLRRFADGTAVWTSPLGRHYSVEPHAYD